ncbi:hypothetical protein FQN57_005140 [Myotisia sp. PD_48]|nr:hypothetical protein FQN57_005140 [Myotisia sp. PD_48]
MVLLESKKCIKSWSERDSLLQKRRRLKKTLQKQLHKYNKKCLGDVYLLIYEENKYFTIKYTRDELPSATFPPPDKEVENHYPPPVRVTSGNDQKQQQASEKRPDKEL